ncbi:DUF3040 domain-containing protein [Kitasatospora sp. NBC_01539]|uniref:DUF3040 domain-containing protein n=1 Tax=Kitasatospora sp. NBC_01539 TaxID=2903577 RepID=UPI00386029BA
MDGPSLSWHELKLLQEIERELRTDTALDRRLSTMRTGRFASTYHSLVRGPVAPVVLLLVGSFGLLALGATVPAAAAWTVFGAVWLAAAIEVVLGVRRLAARHRRHPEPPGA